MGKFIEEFYYGNLDPQARSTKENKAVQKQMEVLMLNEEFLTENLSGESKKKFLDFVNASYHCLSTNISFPQMLIRYDFPKKVTGFFHPFLIQIKQDVLLRELQC